MTPAAAATATSATSATSPASPTSPTLPLRKPARLGPDLRYRLAVASRALAAIGGGYVLSALATTALAVWLPVARAEAVITATLASFVVYAGAVMWVFAARTAWRAWAGLALPCTVLALALWLLQRPGAIA